MAKFIVGVTVGCFWGRRRAHMGQVLLDLAHCLAVKG
jgi:hypothetical protein